MNLWNSSRAFRIQFELLGILNELLEFHVNFRSELLGIDVRIWNSLQTFGNRRELLKFVCELLEFIVSFRIRFKLLESCVSFLEFCMSFWNYMPAFDQSLWELVWDFGIR